MSKPPIDEPIAFEPNCSLKDAVGKDFLMNTLVSKEQIEACENLIDQASLDFFANGEGDLLALQQLCQAPSLQVDAVLQRVYNIRSLAKILGFTLITDLCTHIIDTANSKKLTAAKKPALIAQLVQALTLTFEKQIRDDGGSFGEQLRRKLHHTL